MPTTLHLSIRGHVQGVGFRYYLQREARRHEVTGWVRNRRDGSVEAVLHGDADAVQAVVARARRGPASARVAAVEIDEEAPGHYDTFETRTTA